MLSTTGTVFWVSDWVNTNLRYKNKISMTPVAHSLEFMNDKRETFAPHER